jgi:hypothetical protein
MDLLGELSDSMTSMRFTARSMTLSALLAAPLTLLAAVPAAAHHGWEEYDTTAAYYVSGTTTDVRWGNPHPQVTIEIERPVTVPDDWTELDIPPELEEIGGQDVLDATQAYAGEAETITMDLAPIERLSAWGMDGQVEPGDWIEAVGYIDRDDNGHLRPELIVLESGQVVRQRSVPLADPPEAPADGSGAEAGSGDAAGGEGSGDSGDGEDDATASGGSSSESSSDSASDSAAEADDGSSSAVIWVLVAAGVVVVAGGGFYIVRRSNRG